MKVESSSINFESRHTLTELSRKQESLQFWIGSQNPEVDGPPGVTIDISQKGKELQSCLNTGKTQPSEEEEDLLSEKDRQKIMLIEAFIEHFTGKKYKFRLPKRIHRGGESAPGNGNGRPPEVRNRAPESGWGLIYDSKTTNYESEKMSFRSKGIVKTADGKEIAIDVQLNMSREFFSESEIHIRAGDALKKDPLVINFNAPAAMLTDNKFRFDIDSDGTPDQISRLVNGCGFLSLDLNNDGKINDGSELFGAKSGDGFADLSLYDSDKNGWIDENDSIFEKLRIWTKDEFGNDTLFALGEKGIGAICLGNVRTLFSIRDNDNKENGAIQKTGIFLYENGGAGTLQHVDLVV